MAAMAAENQRYEEGEGSEHKAPAQVHAQVIHVYLYACEEHQVEDAHLAEHLEALVLVENAESVGTHGHARYDKSDDIGNFEPVEHQGGHKQNGHHREEDGHRLAYERG